MVESKMKFGEITSVSGIAFYVSQLSGILGLAYDTISVGKLPPFLDASNLEDKSFSFFLSENPEQSYMTLPGYDEEIMQGKEFQFHKVVERKYYSLNLTGLKNGDDKIDTKGFKAVIDSGTSVIVGPQTLIRPLLSGIVVDPDCSNVHTLPNITFEIDNIPYTLEAEDYVLRVSQFGKEQCVVALMPAMLPEGFKYIILGDTFMRKYYSYFDKNKDRVGFIDMKEFKK